MGGAEYSELYDRSAVPTFTVDLERRAITRVNPAALELLGLPEGEVLGRPASDFLLEPSSDQALHSRDARFAHTVVVRDVRTALGPRTVELHVVPTGEAGVAFIQAVDLTDVLDAARRSESRAAELAEQRAMLASIATRLAHDLRGPMGTIAGMADLLGQPGRLDAEQRADLVERVRATARALISMTDSILDEAGGADPETVPGSHRVDDLVDSLRTLVDAQLAEVGGTLAVSADTDVLPVPVSAIGPALLNLVSNSIKYRHAARPLEILIEVRSADGETEIVVSDNGRGLPPDPDHLFERGRRGEASGGTEGAGLGLTFARGAVERVGGSLTARPLPDGAEFTVSLPWAASEPVPDADDDAPPGTTLTAAQLERIVDASPIPTIVIDIVARQIVRVNQAGIRLFGDADEVLGHAAAEFVDAEGVADALRRQVIEGAGVARAHEVTVRAREGPRTADVWLAAVEGTSFAIAHLILGDDAGS